MRNILSFCMKDISFTSFSELFIWIGTAVLITLGVLELMKNNKK